MTTRTLADLLTTHDLLPLAWRAATTAGLFLRDERPTDLAVDSKSTPTDNVTEMDRTAEALISGIVLGARPNDGILGEEGGERVGTSGVRWVVDPLDGTVNYLFGLPMWGVSVAAEVDGTTEVGVVVTPAFQEAYIAVRGQGAWLVRGDEARRLHGSECTDLSSALITTGFAYAPATRRHQSDVVTGFIAEIRDVRRMGSAVIDFCWLSRGRVDAYFEQGLHAWDYAAGALIAAEAGMVVTGLLDDDFSDLVLASAPGIHGPLRERLVALDAGAIPGA